RPDHRGREQPIMTLIRIAILCQLTFAHLMEEDSEMTTRHWEPGRFARTLARLRSTARLSPEELARLAGVSVDLVQSLEQGRTANPTLRTLLRLAGALGVTVGELIEDAEECSNGGTAPRE